MMGHVVRKNESMMGFPMAATLIVSCFPTLAIIFVLFTFIFNVVSLLTFNKIKNVSCHVNKKLKDP